MNLVIDEGNTRTKTALFEGETLIHIRTFECAFDEIDIQELSHSSCECCIVSSVKNSKSHFDTFLNQFKIGIYLDAQTPIPISNLYKSKDTLGNDRLAAAVGAWDQARHKNILVIDAGTAITYEYLTEAHEYLGGSISPGMALRFEILNKGTSNLPNVSKSEKINMIGTNTVEAIQAGVIKGICHEIDGVIDQFLATYINTSVIGTGGDINFFDKNLKNSIFVLPNLVLNGLNRILIYNA